METLVLETEPRSATSIATDLVARGHRVWRCHEPDAGAFPCRALAGVGQCPLDAPGIDVAVTVRASHRAEPSPYEDGVGCALRARVPVVVVTSAPQSPYDELAADIVERDVVDACERALRRPSAVHSSIATVALRAALRRRAGIDSRASGRVHRSRDGLDVRLEGLTGLDTRTRGVVVAEVMAAVRAYDRDAPIIDVVAADR
jgi:hypothetical protein